MAERRPAPLQVTFAVNYGGRDELSRAAVRTRCGTDPDLQRQLYRPELPDLDLVVRAGGEQRLSNFMLWQAAYAELVFTDTLWPDFTGLHLGSALHEYANRRRRLGGVEQRVDVRIGRSFA